MALQFTGRPTSMQQRKETAKKRPPTLEASRLSWKVSEGQVEPGAHEPSPFKDTASFWRIMAQAATIVMAVILFGVFLYFARPLLVPLMSALVVSLTLGPLAARATKLGLPDWVPALVIVTALLWISYVAILLVSEPASDLIGRSGEIGATIREKFRFMDRPLLALRELQAAVVGSSGISVDVKDTTVLQAVVTALPSFVLQFVLFVATLFFFVFGRQAFRRSIATLFASRDGRLRALRIVNDVEENLSAYLITVTLINIGVGIVAALVSWALGFPAPIVWGALAFVLNYIPYVGPGIMQVTFFLIGLMTFDTLAPALIAPLLFMAFTFIEGQFLVPAVIARQLLLHPLLVFLSLAFWAWLWGPMGAFLATPILIMAIVTLDHLYPRIQQSLPE
jgi:predicted PurR-regulated permease PerM